VPSRFLSLNVFESAASGDSGNKKVGGHCGAKEKVGG